MRGDVSLFILLPPHREDTAGVDKLRTPGKGQVKLLAGREAVGQAKFVRGTDPKQVAIDLRAEGGWRTLTPPDIQ